MWSKKSKDKKMEEDDIKKQETITHYTHQINVFREAWESKSLFVENVYTNECIK